MLNTFEFYDSKSVGQVSLVLTKDNNVKGILIEFAMGIPFASFFTFSTLIIPPTMQQGNSSEATEENVMEQFEFYNSVVGCNVTLFYDSKKIVKQIALCFGDKPRAFSDFFSLNIIGQPTRIATGVSQVRKVSGKCLSCGGAA